jgi:hypothetical protein
LPFNKKNIVGLIGDNMACQTTAEILHRLGFYKVCISDKVKEIAKYLLKLNDDEITAGVINQIRNRGYHVNRLYWINLTLAAVPDNKELIVISDLRLEDVIQEVISPYFVAKKEEKNDCPPDIEFIEKLTEPHEFKTFLENKFKPLLSKSV